MVCWKPPIGKPGLAHGLALLPTLWLFIMILLNRYWRDQNSVRFGVVCVWIHHSPVGLGRLSGQQCFVIIAHIPSCSQHRQLCSAGRSSQLILTVWIYLLSDTKGKDFVICLHKYFQGCLISIYYLNFCSKVFLMEWIICFISLLLLCHHWHL